MQPLTPFESVEKEYCFSTSERDAATGKVEETQRFEAAL